MKKVVSLILVIVCISVLIVSCNKTNDSNKAPKFTFDKKGNYTGFSNLPSSFTIQEAKNAGYFVTINQDIAANKNVWDNFVETSLHKKNTSIRIVKFYAESISGPFFLDLFYKNGRYYLFDSSAENKEKQPFLYLLTLEGKFGNPLKNSGAVVLTNDNKLTFETVMKSLLSSDMNYIKSISPFRIVMFK